SSRRRHTRSDRDWSSDVCSSDLVTKRFGGLTALHGVDFALERGIASIIGPNGAGKTTLVNVFTGLYVPDDGSGTFRGQALLGLRSEERRVGKGCRAGRAAVLSTE